MMFQKAEVRTGEETSARAPSLLCQTNNESVNRELFERQQHLSFKKAPILRFVGRNIGLDMIFVKILSKATFIAREL